MAKNEKRFAVFGKLLESNREKKKLMPEELAKKISRSHSYIRALESGGKVCSWDVFRDLIHALEINDEQRLELLNAIIGDNLETQSSVFDSRNVSVFLTVVLRSSQGVISQQELEKLLSIQAQFSHVLGTQTISSLLAEFRAHSPSI